MLLQTQTVCFTFDNFCLVTHFILIKNKSILISCMHLSTGNIYMQTHILIFQEIVRATRYQFTVDVYAITSSVNCVIRNARASFMLIPKKNPPYNSLIFQVSKTYVSLSH